MPRGGEGDFIVVGANQLDALAKRLKAAGESGKGLRKELLKQLRATMKPLVKDVKDSANTLPHRGGLARQTAKRVSARTRATGRQAGIQVVAKSTGWRLDSGRLRHPLFGNRGAWFQQDVRPGWFTHPLEAGAPKVREALVQAIDDIARKVEG